jgi:hypothetical protein
METPDKQSKGQELDDRWAWTVIALIIGGVTFVLWLPVLKHLVG